jgi:tRNA dimethylallyltransferase
LQLRDELETFRLKNGNEALWKKLHDIDPTYADMLHINNYRYVMRGIEVMLQTGVSKLLIKDERVSPYNILFITPFDGNRDALYQKINARIEQMFSDGLIEEVRNLIERTPKNSP